jgi:hypothetical protein
VGAGGLREEGQDGLHARRERHLAAVEAGRPTEYYASSL